ncbi:MAG: tetratricopeptide repeat protein [Sulfurimonas sp.]|uniref:tetratricopeptide repeat protein n=1 Tax=Sulfurimonas sp. TaxID=2022749 RepID=UPI0028CE83FC|nr:tetratricopeptide repeat protein [Sulfurimonas sp.]MDT8337840.1 tetratricopeptide repeat protein [Sulfurimonas sp.]
MKKLLVFFLFINSLLAFENDHAYISAIKYYAAKDYEKSKLAFEQSISNCPKCNTDSYFYLALHYDGSRGKEKDLQKVFGLALKGAELGSAIAQFGLAEYYRWGTGTAQDTQKATYWFKKAIEQKTKSSSVSSMYNLGIIYYNGEGNVAVDKKLAYKYWMKCVDSDVSYPEAKEGCQNNLDILCKQSPWACK